MNKHDAHDYIPLLQALGDGKTIQFYAATINEWKDLDTVDFSYSAKYYRMKPEPRTFEILINTTTGVVADGRDLIKTSSYDWERITVQEVLA